jgi:hypothetical protein
MRGFVRVGTVSRAPKKRSSFHPDTLKRVDPPKSDQHTTKRKTIIPLHTWLCPLASLIALPYRDRRASHTGRNDGLHGTSREATSNQLNDPPLRVGVRFDVALGGRER